MWHAVSPVASDYDPIVYEGKLIASVSVMNSGPGSMQVWAWTEDISQRDDPEMTLELRPGNTRIASARLLRAHLISGDFCAIAWRVLSHGW